jgi:hypothetical protein
MDNHKLKRTSVKISIAAADGYSAHTTFKSGMFSGGAVQSGQHNNVNSPESTLLEAIEELGRLSVLFGFEQEALLRFNTARARAVLHLKEMAAV